MNVRISMGVYDGMWKIERKAGEGWTAHPAGVVGSGCRTGRKNNGMPPFTRRAFVSEPPCES